MLSEVTVSEIQSLLSEATLSQREIARKLGVNRQTVNWIARGKRAPAHEKAKRQVSVRELSKPIRCSACGN